MKKKIMTFVMAGLMLSSTVVNTHAYEGDITDTTKIETWKQWDYPNLSGEVLRNGGETVSSSACGYFALTSAAIKEGSVGEGYTPDKLIHSAKEKGLQNTWWGHFNFQKVEELGLGLKLPSIKEFGNAKRSGGEYENYSWNISGNWEQKQQTIRDLYNAGYYVILCLTNSNTDGHYVFVDYVDIDGRIRITDSAYKGTWLDEEYSGGFNYAIILESIDGNKANEMPSVYSYDNNSKKFNKIISDINAAKMKELMKNMKNTPKPIQIRDFN